MDTTPNFYDFFDAVVAYRKKHGKVAAKQLLQNVTGFTDLADVHRSQYAEVIEATRLASAKTAEQAASSSAWKKIEAACRNGHANVVTGLKTNQ